MAMSMRNTHVSTVQRNMMPRMTNTITGTRNAPAISAGSILSSLCVYLKIVMICLIVPCFLGFVCLVFSSLPAINFLAWSRVNTLSDKFTSRCALLPTMSRRVARFVVSLSGVQRPVVGFEQRLAQRLAEGGMGDG